VFGGYRIEEVAGRGGMGVVYRAVQLDLGRPVALKLIAADRAADPDFRERFQRESRMAAAIDHPNVVPVHGAGEHDGQLYLVMRYVRGTDLHALIKREGPLDPVRAAAIVGQVASALDAAHAAGLVHRDVKPANVLLGGSGRQEHAYLSDFGLTRLLASETQLTETGQWMGTIDFSAPEQLSALRLDARADIYSLGCVLHAALVGTPPFPRGTFPATLLAHMQDPIPRPSERGAPSGFDRVMARALAKAPEDRYLSAGDLGRAAWAAARGEPVTESERSVAVGPAAPESPTNGHVPHGASGRGGPLTAATVVESPTSAATVADATAVIPATQVKDAPRRKGTQSPLIPPPPGDAPTRHRGRRRGVVLAAGLVAAVAAATAIALALGDGVGAGSATGPLSENDVRDVAQDFAQAYEAEDGAALRRTLTPGVQRVLPTGVARGRATVVGEYERQFRSQDTRGYELEDLEVSGGRAGRASAAYRVDRNGRDAIEGRIVFGVVRDHGRPRIGLIAVTPTG
jgi:serine/threonine protein kinase